MEVAATAKHSKLAMIDTTHNNNFITPAANHRVYPPCTLHVFAAGLIGRLAGRASLPGATFGPLCH
jgi:hypothetical protein